MMILYELVRVVASLLLVPIGWCCFSRAEIRDDWILVNRRIAEMNGVRFLTAAIISLSSRLNEG